MNKERRLPLVYKSDPVHFRKYSTGSQAEINIF